MAKRRRGYVEVQIDDILDEIDDDALLGEVENRGLEIAKGVDSPAEIREAYEALRCNRRAEALAILDRLLNPKWTSQAACLDAFVKSQGKMI